MYICRYNYDQCVCFMKTVVLSLALIPRIPAVELRNILTTIAATGLSPHGINFYLWSKTRSKHMSIKGIVHQV